MWSSMLLANKPEYSPAVPPVPTNICLKCAEQLQCKVRGGLWNLGCKSLSCRYRRYRVEDS